MTDEHYGMVINHHYDWINMLTKMESKNPQRFNEFQYSEQTIYHYLDKLQHEQNLYD
jgi:23S rRNA maturation-related 3'-5' exoribonuclease YhaM